MRSAVVLFVVALLAACTIAPTPASLNTRSDVCSSCRMVISDQHFASQIAAPYEEPRFFDDMGCLQRYLESNALSKGAAIFVADHRTGEWIPSAAAVYSRVDALAAPMGSHIVAHASTASRAADPDAASGVDVDGQTVFAALRRAGGLR